MKNRRYIAAFIAVAMVLGLVGGIVAPPSVHAQSSSSEDMDRMIVQLLLEMIELLQKQIALLIEQQGGGGTVGRMTICHYPESINPQTITISTNAWAAHSAHGDHRGACDTDDGDWDLRAEADMALAQAEDSIDEGWRLLDEAENEGLIDSDEEDEFEEELEEAEELLGYGYDNFHEPDYEGALEFAERAEDIAEERVIEPLWDILDDVCHSDEDCAQDEYLNVELISHDSSSTDNDNGETIETEFDISVRIEAHGDDFFIPVNGVSSYNTSPMNFLFAIEDPNTNQTKVGFNGNVDSAHISNSSADEFHGFYEIREGDDEVFTVSIVLDESSGIVGAHRLQLKSVRYYDDATTFSDSWEFNLRPEGDYQTGSEVLDNTGAATSTGGGIGGVPGGSDGRTTF